MAEAILKHRAKGRGLTARLLVDSAGTGDWHAGERADSRARALLLRHKIESDHLARQLTSKDFVWFDYLLVMDVSNYQNVLKIRPPDSTAKVGYLRDYDPTAGAGKTVPDPYYDNSFENVFELVDRSVSGFLDTLFTRGTAGR